MSKTWNYQPAGDITITTTGNIDNLDFEYCSLIIMNNASLATIRGLKAGFAGQEVTIISIGAGDVYFANQNAGSTDINRLVNRVTSCVTPIAAGVGAAKYQYDTTTSRWRLVEHQQGGLISIAFSAGNFTSAGGGTAWTVIAANQDTYGFQLVDNIMTIFYRLESTNVTGTPTDLQIAIPLGATVKNAASFPFQAINAGVPNFGPIRAVVGESIVRMQSTVAGAGWTATAGSDTFTRGTFPVPIT